jgi:hypothetical protein
MKSLSFEESRELVLPQLQGHHIGLRLMGNAGNCADFTQKAKLRRFITKIF